MNAVMIGDRPVGGGAPVYIIAEAGSEPRPRPRPGEAPHRGRRRGRRRRGQVPDLHARTGSWPRPRPGRSTSTPSCRPARRCPTSSASSSCPHEWHAELKTYAEGCGLDFVSTPFDHEAVDLLDGLGRQGVQGRDLRAVAPAAHPGHRVTRQADHLLDRDGRHRRGAGGGRHGPRDRQPEQLILLHCVVNYPPPFAELNLRAIATMRQAFGVPVGWSDHTPGWLAPVVATALGAAVVEKHFTTDRIAARAGSPVRARARRAGGHGPGHPRRRGRARRRREADGAGGGGPVRHRAPLALRRARHRGGRGR